MKIWRTPEEDRLRAKARKRLSRLGTHEILNWADMAGSGMAKGLDDYRRNADAESLAEIRNGLIALLAAVDEITGRAGV